MKQRPFLLMLASFCLFGNSIWAQTFTQGNLKYTVTDADAKTVSVAKINDITGELVIPSTVSNEGVTYAVTSVPDNGFSQTSITSVTVPSTMMSLGSRAFGECRNLASVRIEYAGESLAMQAGYYGSFAYSGNGMAVYVDREMSLSETNSPFSGGNVQSVEIGPKVAAVTPYLFYNVPGVASVTYSPNATVTSIGNYAFKGCSSLSSVALPSSVTTIGDYAFGNAGRADDVEEMVVTLGSGLTTIGEYAFSSCTHLKSITLPSSLTEIKGYAFSESGLTAVTIPASVTSLGSRAFGECRNLASVRIEYASESLAMQAGYYGSFAYSGNGMAVYVDREMSLSENNSPFSYGNVQSVEIGSKVAAVTPYLFSGVSSVASVTSSRNAVVTSIGNYAFRGCSSLSSVSLPASVATIGDYAFESAGSAENVEETVVTLGSGLATIGEYAFSSCTHLKSIPLPSALADIKNYAFSESGLTAVTIPASVTSLGSRAFGGCRNLADVRIEYASESLAMQAGYYGSFAYSGNGMSVYVDREMSLSENNSPFSYGNVQSVEIGSKVAAVTPYLFYEVSSVASVTSSRNAVVTSIGNYAFKGCSSLSSVALPSSVTTIGDYAFENAGRADDVEETLVTLGSGLATIGEYAFSSCTHLKSIPLPSALADIKNYAFSESGLTAVTIPASVTSLGSRAFGGCRNLANVRIEYAGESLAMQAGYYGSFAYSGNGMAVYVDREMSLSENNSPFSYGNVQSVEIGSKVAAITPYLFYDVPGVASVTSSPNATVESIGNYAFRGCTSLSSLSLPASLTTIGDYAFENAGSAGDVEETVVTLGSGLTTIGEYAFSSCTHLKSIPLPSALADIKNYAFSESGLTAVTIPASVTSLGSRAFGGCPDLADVRIENASESLAMQAGYYGSFAYSDAQKTVYIGRDIVLSEQSTPFSNIVDVEFSPQVTTLCSTTLLNTQTGLNSIKVHWQTPISVTEGHFSQTIFDNTRLLVPVGTIPAYKAATGWKKFFNIEEDIIEPTIHETEYQTCCEYCEWHGQRYTESGTYTCEEKNEQGVVTDIYTLELTIHYSTTSTLRMDFYVGDHYVTDMFDFTVGKDGEDTYYYTTTNAAGCDSIITLTVTILEPQTYETNATITEGESYEWRGNTYTEAGTYTDEVLTEYGGVKEIYILNLTVKEPDPIHYTFDANGHDYVDLGLPTGTLWATCNIGATVPEGMGDFFAWGETEPKDGVYGWTTYKYCNGTQTTQTKYCIDSNYGTVDGKTVLEPEDDAAAVNWGGTWRMPTIEEIQELLDNTTWQETTVNGVRGMKFTSKENDSYIFFPFSGYRDEGNHFGYGERGFYWSNKLLDPNGGGGRLYMWPTYGGVKIYSAGRCHGLSVRGVLGALAQDEEGYYQIASANDWKLFAKLVGTETVVNARMTADIDLGDDQTMVGTVEHPYQGTFDGQGHTLTVNLNSYYTFDIEAVAPFACVKDATIKKLHVAGSLKQQYCAAGGVVGNIQGNLTVSQCWVSAYLYVQGFSNYQGTIGGIASYCDDPAVTDCEIVIEDCIFSGEFGTGIHSGSMMSHVNGGYGNHATLRNCLNIGTFPSASGSSGTFIRPIQGDSFEIDNCFYMNSFGYTQGTHATEEQLANGTTARALQAGRSEQVWVQDLDLGQPMLMVFSKNPDPDGIEEIESLTPALSKGEGAVYDLGGRKLSGKPSTPGLYIVGGKKVMVK